MAKDMMGEGESAEAQKRRADANLQNGSEVFISVKDGPKGQTGFLAKIPAGGKVRFSKGPDGELEMVPEPDTEPPTLKAITAAEIEKDPDPYRQMLMQTVDLRRANGPDDNVTINRDQDGYMSASVGGNAKLKQGVVSMTDAEATAAVPSFDPQQKSSIKLGAPG